MTTRSPFGAVSRLLLPAVLLFAALHGSQTAQAQSTSATLSGRVTDTNDAVVPSAQVTATNVATGLKREATTSSSGTFTIPLLPPSTYSVLVESQGFTPAEIKDVTLNVGDNVALNIQLKVGAVGATVDVRGDAQLTSELPSVGTVVDRQFVENMPLNGRSFQSLIALTPGVLVAKTSANAPGQFSVSGQRTNANYFTIDGVSANFAGSRSGQAAGGTLPAFSATGGTNNLVSVDAMQEFRIQTSTYAPEFGRTPGGQIQIVTRSGTNRFHGSLFEYFRNDVLDANDWFANSRRSPRPALRQNDFGGVVGGPIVKNRSFFFFSYEGLRLRQPLFFVTQVPSLAARQAAPPAFRPLLNAYPIPTSSAVANGYSEYAASVSNPTFLNATSIRVDHRLGNRVSLFARYNYSPSGVDERGTLGRSLNTLTLQRYKTQTLTLGSTQSLTPRINNEFRFNLSQDSATFSSSIDDFGGATPPADSVLFPAAFGTSQDSTFFLLLAGGVNTTLAAGTDRSTRARQFNVVDNFGMVYGSHDLKFGVDYRRLTPRYFGQKYNQTINELATGVNAAVNGVAELAFVVASEDITLLFNNLSLYGQDTWRVNKRTTLTYGMRWEVNSPPTVLEGPAFISIAGADNPATSTVAPEGAALYKTHYNNFAPRVGVAYQLSQKPKQELVLRGGFGVFYDLGYGSIGEIQGNYPAQRRNFFFGVPYPLTTAQQTPPPLVRTPPFAVQLLAFDPNIKLPYTLQWNLALERSLGSNQTISASYVGSAGRRLPRRVIVLGPNALFQSALFITKSDVSSSYHSLQAHFQRRVTRGLQTFVSYTWAHSIDEVSDDATALGGALISGSSDYDVRHSFSGAATYNIPNPKENPVAKAVFGDWSIDTLFTARSGTPVELRAGTVFIGGNIANRRPNLVPGVPLYVDNPAIAGGRVFNRAAFAIPPGTQQGNLGRNVMRGFSIWQVDMALRRQFDVTERVNLQFRAEAFNIFNHPNFGDPVGDLNSSLFGQSISMFGRSLGSGGLGGGFNPLYQVGGPRSMQLALKIQF